MIQLSSQYSWLHGAIAHPVASPKVNQTQEINKQSNTIYLAGAPLHHVVILQQRYLPLQVHLCVELCNESVSLHVHPGIGTALRHPHQVDTRFHHRLLEQLLIHTKVVALDTDKGTLTGVAEEVVVVAVDVSGMLDGERHTGDKLEHTREGVIPVCLVQAIVAPAAEPDAP